VDEKRKKRERKKKEEEEERKATSHLPAHLCSRADASACLCRAYRTLMRAQRSRIAIKSAMAAGDRSYQAAHSLLRTRGLRGSCCGGSLLVQAQLSLRL